MLPEFVECVLLLLQHAGRHGVSNNEKMALCGDRTAKLLGYARVSLNLIVDANGNTSLSTQCAKFQDEDWYFSGTRTPVGRFFPRMWNEG